MERLARARACRVGEEMAHLAQARAVLEALRAERTTAKDRQRDAEQRARTGLMHTTGEGRTAALEALVVGSRRLDEVRARVRVARAEFERCQQRLEAERAHEKAALMMADERTRAVDAWRLGREQDEIDESFRVRAREVEL